MALYITLVIVAVMWIVALIVVICICGLDGESISELILLIPAGALLFFGIYGIGEESKPAKVYERRVKAADKANKELQKFLIDHPEFVTEEPEADD